MEIPKTYQPTKIESKWYAEWLQHRLFRSQVSKDKKPYTIVIPPPNVTGVLHMGHMLNNTIQDVLIRRARMLGFNACWVPGTDHASIATEAKVVNKLREQGIEKSSLTREEFLQHAWEWKEKHGGIILEQLKKLGASCDWDRTRFTMDDDMSEAVIDVFIDLYQKGLIYRGIRMINWDPKAQTALSDEEVIYREVQSKLYHVAYDIEGSDEKIVIATTRPETILGDTAICVHPEDVRYKHLAGKKAIVPLINRSIPIIFDEYVDMEFGTGALKVTPAHDVNDYQLGIKHQLEVIDVIDSHGKMSESAQLFIGEDRFVVRKKIAKALEASGNLIKIEDLFNKVGFSERTDEVIEPRISLQWFCKMDVLAKPALEAVTSGKIQLHPQKFVNTYKHWMENVKDWCVSRQLWWGQRIPAWYDSKGNYVVAKTAQEAIQLFAAQSIKLSETEIRQDEDVLDTWFSSWLWPISVFDGFKDPNNPEINYYYPTNDLVTAPEILFFWVARMIMAGLEYRKDIPFKNVYLTGIVRDKLGRKMSKSLGNSPDPIDLINKYGADGVRVGMLLTSPAGNDLPFDESLCEQGRNFNNKLWNAFRLVAGWHIDSAKTAGQAEKDAVDWFGHQLEQKKSEIFDAFDKYRISDALMLSYKFVWDDFCAWYLEAVKPTFGEGIDAATHSKTLCYLREVLKLLHPFMPFITEEIWQHIRQMEDTSFINQSLIAAPNYFNPQVVKDFEHATQIVSTVRNFRQSKGISPKEQLPLYLPEQKDEPKFSAVILKLANLSGIHTEHAAPAPNWSELVGTLKLEIPVADMLDKDAEADRIEKEIQYLNGFLLSIDKKLTNERFVSNAKAEVVEMERKKKADAELKIQSLSQQLEALKG
ncbi:MAG: valine--tRNA ligase [Flavobacteriales bacterium]